ncbi:universal stress protein [Flagellimonas sediminis]|uniref:Universal stress protein n=1 Tax=Flagellimonas sediminis TaxID=2696468 RepID=A0A6I5L1G2_9FLAO|nr:universal stress protein [Allomuricauda sediminis]NDV43601.1 universal stress protein [Allomuricauda sediminis]
MKTKRIILPTDFSKNAWNAMIYALAIFKEVPCDFYVLNAFQVGTSGLGTKIGMANDTHFFNLLKEESEREVNKTLDQLHQISTNPDHHFHGLSIADNLVNAIGRTVYNKGMDYIIMGTKGASGLKEVFMGSNTYKIIREIDFCPIIAVPDDYQCTEGLRTILLVTGYEHLFESYELSPVVQLAEMFHAKIQMAHVTDGNLTKEQEHSKKTLKLKFKSVPIDFIEVKKETTVQNSIQKIIGDDQAIDLVAMINHDRGFFERLTREPVIKKIAFNSIVPFLVIHLFE